MLLRFCDARDVEFSRLPGSISERPEKEVVDFAGSHTYKIVSRAVLNLHGEIRLFVITIRR